MCQFNSDSLFSQATQGIKEKSIPLVVSGNNNLNKLAIGKQCKLTKYFGQEIAHIMWSSTTSLNVLIASSYIFMKF